MRDRHTAIRLMGLVLLISSRACGAGVDDLRCEYLREPQGVDTPQPRLSWIINSNRRGERQTAYQVLVASREELLGKDQGDLWDSGKVESGQSVQVEYAGRPLESRQRCHWQVRIWDKEGQPAAWSRPSLWTMGLLKAEDWRAKWITMQVSAGLPHPWLRRSFELKSAATRAEVYVNTPGHYELYINGQKVGPDVLAPAHVNLKKRFLYNVYDVTSMLKKGPNGIALWMAPGWYQPAYGNPHRAPIVRAQLEVRSAEGSAVIGTDAQWRVADSCISQIGPWAWNNMGGERWEAAKFVPGWNQTTFDDSRWAPAVEVPAPAVEHSWQALPGSRLRPPIAAKRIYPHKDKWVVDNQIHQVTVSTYHTQIPCGALGGGEAREKLGYGDGGSFLSGMLYNLQSDAFFQKWLRDWCDGQRADGFLGHTAPEYYPAGGGPSWGGQASELVRRLYLYYGDRRAVASAYGTLKKYLDHLESHAKDDLLRYFNLVIAKQGHLDTGLQGTFMLLDLLTNERRPDLVALLMNQTTFPGWGFLLMERQVTSWPETWSGWGSQIIQVVGTPGAWFYEGLAGIRPDPEQPGFKHFVIRPGIVDAVDWVKCRYRSPYGDIVSNWKRTDGKLELEVSVPPNTTATVAVPITGAGTVTESGKDIAAAETIRLLRREAGQTLYELQPGRYVLQSTISP